MATVLTLIIAKNNNDIAHIYRTLRTFIVEYLEFLNVVRVRYLIKMCLITCTSNREGSAFSYAFQARTKRIVPIGNNFWNFFRTDWETITKRNAGRVPRQRTNPGAKPLSIQKKNASTNVVANSLLTMTFEDALRCNKYNIRCSRWRLGMHYGA